MAGWIKPPLRKARGCAAGADLLGLGAASGTGMDGDPGMDPKLRGGCSRWIEDGAACRPLCVHLQRGSHGLKLC